MLWISRETDEAREAKVQAMEFFGAQRKILAEAGMKYAHAIVARITRRYPNSRSSTRFRATRSTPS